MNVTKRKKKITSKFSSIGATITLLLIQCNTCLAETIGTAEVEAATDNIKRVITWRSFNFCEYSYCCFKNDCQC